MIRAFIGGYVSVFIWIIAIVAFALHSALLCGFITAAGFLMGLGFYEGLKNRNRINTDSE